VGTDRGAGTRFKAPVLALVLDCRRLGWWRWRTATGRVE